MIQLHVAKTTQEETYKVVYVIGCVFQTRGIVLCKSHDVERVEDAGRVLTMGGTENGGESGNNRNIYSSSCDLIHILLCAG